MSRVTFDMGEKRTRRRGIASIPLRFIAWTALLTGLIFWATLIFLI